MSLLQVDGVTCRFGGLLANRDVSFDVAEGRIMGLIGPNGAGKSTLFSIVAGAQRPTSGRLRFNGADVTGWAPHDAAAAGVARTFQLMRVFASMTVADNVTAAAYLRHRHRRDARRRADEVIEQLGLGAVADASSASLTAAWKKRLELARAVATSPKLLLLDEVLSGLTPAESRAAVDLIRALNDQGMTILMVEHVMEIIMPLCGEIVVLNHGQKIAQGPPAEVVEDPAVVDAYLGRSEGRSNGRSERRPEGRSEGRPEGRSQDRSQGRPEGRAE